MLWSASAISALGDGMRTACVPLLAVSFARDPRAVALVTGIAYVPWLLFALPSGALVDRLDRRRVMWTTNLFRGLVVGVLTAALLTGHASLVLLIVAAFLLGCGQTLFDPASQAILPQLLPADHLPRANGRLSSGQLIMGRFAGPPAGTALFALAPAWPFLVDAVSFLISALLVWSIPGAYGAGSGQAAQRMRHALGEGLRWVATQPALRALSVSSAALNVAGAAASSLGILYVIEYLRLPASAYGVLLSVVACASIVASTLAPRMARMLGTARTLRLSVLGASAGLVALSVTGNRVAAVAVFAWSGFWQTIWNVLAVSYRQVIVPRSLLGRSSSVFRFLSWGSVPLGAALGGILAHAFGLQPTYAMLAVLPVAAGALVLRRLPAEPVPAATTAEQQHDREALRPDQERPASAAGPPGHAHAPAGPGQQAAPGIADGLRQAMGKFATGVTVVTARADGVEHAMTANSLVSVSLHPPLVLFCVRRGARFRRAVLRSGHWGVSVLGADQEHVSRWCARSERTASDQLGGFPVVPGPSTGAPLLAGAVATLECRTVSTQEAGDHTIVIGQVLATATSQEPVLPLIFYERGYHTILALARSVAPARSQGQRSPPAFTPDGQGGPSSLRPSSSRGSRA